MLDRCIGIGIFDHIALAVPAEMALVYYYHRLGANVGRGEECNRGVVVRESVDTD